MLSSDLPKLWTEPTKISHIFRKQLTLKIKKLKISFIKVDLIVKYSSQKKNQNYLVDFWCQKMTLKVQILQTLRRLFIILVGLTMIWFSEKMLISSNNIWQLFNLDIDDLAVKPYIPHKSLIQWICCKCLAW